MQPDKIDEWSSAQIIAALQDLSPYEFEEFIGDLWELQGWDVKVTSQAGDKGIDIIATKSFPYNKKTLIQAKRYGKKSNVSGPDMQKYASLKQRDNVDEVIVVTTGQFTSQAKVIAQDFNIKLIPASTLAQLVIELSAEKLVESYIDQNAETLSLEKTSTLNGAQTSLSKSNSRLIGDCGIFRMELLGYKYITTEMANIERPKRLNGYIIAFELTNNSERDIKFLEENTIDIYDGDGYSYTPERKFSKDKFFPENWQAKRPKVPPKGKSRFICYVKSSEQFKISTIRFSSQYSGILSPTKNNMMNIPAEELMAHYNCEIHLNKESRQDIQGLPLELSELF